MNIFTARTSWNGIAGTLVLVACLLSNPQAAVAQQTYLVPLITPASNYSQQGFIRIINRSDRAGRVSIRAFDDTGRQFGPVYLSLDRLETAHFNSQDLERGNASKGLSGGVGNGQGNWRLQLQTDLDIEPLAFMRTSDGFLTSMHDIVREAGMCHLVSIFNPGGNRNQQSSLRLINPGSRNAEVSITGRDDRGRAAPGGEVRLTLRAGASRSISAQELESGRGSGLQGGLGDGDGKWQLFVSANQPIHVLSLLRSPTGHLTNLSTSPFLTSSHVDCGNAGTGSGDLRVESVSVSDRTLTPRQNFTFYATVRNHGASTSSPSEVTAYSSILPSGVRLRSPMDTKSVPALAGGASRRITFGGLDAGFLVGTFYFFACVDNPGGDEHCSDSVRVTVSEDTSPPPPPPSQRGVTVSVRDACNDGYRIEYRYFAFDSSNTQTGSWPGGSSFYHTTHYNRVVEHNLECDDETATICLGARQGRWVWGIGMDADRSCSTCCYDCPSSGVKEYRTFGFGCPR